jgi:hypothetical protein
MEKGCRTELIRPGSSSNERILDPGAEVIG